MKERHIGLTSSMNAPAMIRFYRSSGVPFKLAISNYTTSIEADSRLDRFLYALTSNQSFAAYSKIKRDVKDIVQPDIDRSTLEFFHHNFMRNASHKVVYNIDLKSAYAEMLRKAGVLKKDTVDYLFRINKTDRLISVGMLASKKEIFSFDRLGNISSHDTEVSDKENFFFYAVKEVAEVMQNLKNICRENYLFTWVDGIYFLPDRNKLIQCENYLRKSRIRYSEEVLRDWEVQTREDGIHLRFTKEGDPVHYHLPSRQTEFIKMLSDIKTFLNFKNQTNGINARTNEVSKKQSRRSRKNLG